MSTGAATIRKAIGAAAVGAVGSAYAVFTAVNFDFNQVTGSQWEAIALAGITAFTAVYHLPNAPVTPVTADPSLDPLAVWAQTVGDDTVDA